MRLQRITAEPILEPKWDNRCVESYRDWLLANEQRLVDYWVALCQSDDRISQSDFFLWVPCKWESQLLLRRQREVWR